MLAALSLLWTIISYNNFVVERDLYHYADDLYHLLASGS